MTFRTLRRRFQRRRDEHGAVAVIVAAMVVVLFGAAALGVDIAQQVQSKQRLHDTMDTAAHAGAYELPGNGAGAAAAATAMAQANDSTTSPASTFYCIVGATATAPHVVLTSHIPSTCDPGPPPYTALTYPGLRCNDTICAIPCFPQAPQNDVCNTISVADSADVPFAFAPAIGYDEGSTGLITSTACRGSCGNEVPNPMDVAVVADRTGSMSASDVTSMVSGIRGMLQVMTPAQQYVSLGTIGPAQASPSAADLASCRSNPYSGSLSSTGTGWKWHSLPFHDDYLNAGSPATVNNNSDLVKAVNCLTRKSSTGTHLAAPMKAAARYLLGAPNYEPNNLGSMPARTGTPKKVLIFETDGQPNESFSGNSTALGTTASPGNSNGTTACNQLQTVADNAKAQGILIITIAYNLGNDRCASGGSYVTDVLAASASPDSTGAASDSDNDCTTAALRSTENVDGDFFFCAASGDDMSSLFVTAIGSAGGGIRLIRLP